MKIMNLYQNLIIITFFGWTCLTSGDNQTPTISPVYITNTPPFTITIEQADLVLPVGIQSGAKAQIQNKWLFIAGRINGLHGFDNSNNNFPANQQNYSIYVVDIIAKTVTSRSLLDPLSGLTQAEIDTLAVTSPQHYQRGNTLYITGGYGIDTLANNFTTKDTLSAIDVPSLINWVINPSPGQTAKQSIRQITDPVFRVTGGVMRQIGNNPTLLMLGQDFEGPYTPNSNGIYTEQIRRFFINDDGINLSVNILTPSPVDPNLRRRDLNITHVIRRINNANVFGLLALAGVFTESGGSWTVPINITADGTPFMPDPNLPGTFKQGMNIYASPKLGIFSELTNNMDTVIFGRITFEYYSKGSFVTDEEFPIGA